MRGFKAIARLIEDALERALTAGVPREVAVESLMQAESRMVNAVCSDQAKFLSECRNARTSDVAERLSISPRTVRRRRQKALNEKRTQNI
jgi:hypothetical protein